MAASARLDEFEPQIYKLQIYETHTTSLQQDQAIGWARDLAPFLHHASASPYDAVVSYGMILLPGRITKASPYGLDGHVGNNTVTSFCCSQLFTRWPSCMKLYSTSILPGQMHLFNLCHCLKEEVLQSNAIHTPVHIVKLSRQFIHNTAPQMRPTTSRYRPSIPLPRPVRSSLTAAKSTSLNGTLRTPSSCHGRWNFQVRWGTNADGRHL
jgi:hypothetical protein